MLRSKILGKITKPLRTRENRWFCKFSDRESRISAEMNGYSNITPLILSLVDRKIHDIEGHPLHTLKTRLRQFFTDQSVFKSQAQDFLGNVEYGFFEDLFPVGKKFYLFIYF